MPHVNINKDKITKDHLINQAWLIYLYFIAADSCYELGGIPCNLHQVLSRAMASPTRNTFQKCREIALVSLDHSFTSFRETKEFELLCENVLRRSKDHAYHAAVFESRKIPESKGWF